MLATVWVCAAAVAVMALDPAAAQTTNWSGGTDSDWTKNGNWDAGAPNKNTSVVISTATPNPTVLGVSGAVQAETADLLVAANGSLTLQNGSTLSSYHVTSGGHVLGTATVKDGATWNVTTDPSLPAYFAVSFDGKLTISNGGVVATTGDGGSIVGAGPGLAIATVTGLGSQWRTSQFGVGAFGAGVLTIEDHAIVVASSMDLADQGSATVNVNSGGVLEVGLLYVVDPANAQVNFDGGILRSAGGSTLLGFSGTGLNIKAGGLTIDTAGSTVSTDGTSAFSGVGGIRVIGGGRVVLSAVNTYIGDTTITAGTLALAGNGSIATSSKVIADGTFDISSIAAANTNITALAGGGNVTLGNKGLTITGANDTFSGTIAGVGGALIVTSGTQVLTGNNTYTGGTTITGATLQIGNGGGTGSIVGDVTNNGALILNRSGTLTLDGLISGSGSVEQKGPGTTVLTADNTYTGPTSINAGTLQVNGSIVSPTTVLAAGTLGGIGTINNIVTNFGTVSPGTGGLNEALTINGNYVGQGGTLAIRTALEGDSSPTTQLIIAGAGHSATGSTGIVVTNVGGKGAETSGIGIPIVLPQGGATIAGGTFHLAQPVAAGPFEYLLFQGTIDRKGTAAQEQTYYLRNVVEAIGPDGQPILEPDGEPDLIPLYRPDVSIHSVFGAMARQQGLTTLGTFHDRAGDQRLASSSGPRTAAWGRLFGEHMEQSHSGHVNAHFEGNTGGIQAGIDALQWTSASGHQDRFGLMAAYARTSGNVRGFALGETNRMAGRAAIDGTSFGGYWTHLAPSGWYTDTVVVGTRFDADGDTVVGNDLESKGYGVTASIEGGYPIPLMGSLRLEPQAQLVYTHINIDDVNDPYSYVAYETPDALSGRLGVRVSADLLPLPFVLRPYLKANIWQDFTGIDSIYFEGVHEIESRHRATRLELGGGVIAQLSPGVGLWLNADYTTDIASSADDIETIRGTAGLRVTW